MWQLTILLVLKSTLAPSFLTSSSFSSSHVCNVCNGFSYWFVFSVLPMYLGSCTVGCPCDKPWVFWLACHFWNFTKFLLTWSMGGVVCLRFKCLQTIMPSFGLFLRSLLISPKKMRVGVFSKRSQILVFATNTR